MNNYTKLWALLLAASTFTACQQDDIVPDTPDVPTEGYHLTFDGGVGIETGTRASWNDDIGSGNLIFQWDYTPEGTEEYEMVMALVEGDLFASTEGNYHTYASIHKHSEHSDDAHWATFKTLEKYPYDVFSGKYDGYDVLAVTPVCDANGATVSSDVNDFDARMPMPATFTQVADQKPDFLRNYMYMYATSIIANGSASLSFRHIPATFRFIVTNKRPTKANIKSIQVSLADATPVASKSVTVTGAGTPTFSGDTYTTITTLLGEYGTGVSGGERYIAYALALPLADDNAFDGKKIQFTIATDDEFPNEYRSFVLDGSQIEAANRTLAGNGVYNWVGGKSYTIRMSLSDVLTFDGITVTDWTQTEIDGGVAEESEWRNGINIYTGEYEPAGQNAEGEYEVANAGNLMWMSQQINARTLSIPYTIKLVDDITIGEDIEWVPIAHPDGAQNSSVFDGNGYTLSINQNRPTATDAGFGLFMSFNYSTVKNLTIKGNISLNTSGSVGAIAATTYRTTISSVISYANITNLSDSGNVGGLVGQFGGQHSASDNQYSLIENCAVYADVSGSIAGGIIGYGWSGWQYYDIKNTAFYGDVTGTANQGAIIGYHANNQTATQCTFKHIYYYEKDALGFSGGGNTNYTLGTDVAAKTTGEFASPQMAELLNADQENGPWEYLTGNDYPTLKK